MSTTSAAATVIDGSILEGGGQILRNSMAYATLLKKPIVIENIRHNRKPPGLKAQHRTGIELASRICNGTLVGAKNGSTRISFEPQLVAGGSYKADTRTAGSTTLLLQISLPCLLYTSRGAQQESSLTLRGGTNASSAPQIDYTERVLFPFLRKHFGVNPFLKVNKRGYYPKGGGEIYVSLTPVTEPLPSVTITERGAITSVRGKAYVAGLPAHLAQQIADAAVETLVASGLDRSIIDIAAVRESPSDAVGSGSGIALWAESEHECIFGGSALGSKGKDMASVGQEAAQELVANLKHGGCVDEYLQDQIIVFLVLASGVSTVVTGPLTLHTRTAIWVAEQLTDARFEVQEEEGSERVSIKCTGIGIRGVDGAGVNPS